MLFAIIFGFGMGFLSAIPVAGPVSAMVIERALDRRYTAAILIAVGTAIAEGLYAALAVLGFAALADQPWVAPASKGLAGVVLIVVGLAFALRRPKPPPDDDDPDALAERGPKKDAIWGNVLVGFTITAVNPTLLATWAAVTSMLVASEWVVLEPATSIPFGLAVGAGVTAWFVLLVALVKRFTKKLGWGSVARVIKVIGWLLVALGAWFLVLLVRYLIA